jgi:hypothetical protein
MFHEQPDALVKASYERLQASPEQAVMHKEQVGSARNRAFDRTPGEIDCRGDSTHISPMSDLNAI